MRVVRPANHGHSGRIWMNKVEIQGMPALPLIPFYRDVYVTLFPSRPAGRILDEFRPDIVHIQDHYPLSRSFLKQALRRGIPVIGTNNFLPENIIDQIPVFSHMRRLFEKIIWWTVISGFRGAAVVTTPSETAAKIMRQNGFTTPVKAISCGIDLSRFHPDVGMGRDAIRARYGLDPERILLLYVGRLDREKRLEVLIRALHHLGRPEVQLGIAGHGRALEELQDLAQELNLGDQVVFTGFVPDPDLPSLLNSADIFAMPSEAETQSIATLEAMACSLPILASNARALPELVKSGLNGYLFNNGDAADAAACMQSLLFRRNDWQSMGVASLEMAKPHRIENTIQEYEKLYRSTRLAASRSKQVYRDRQQRAIN